MGQRYRRMEDLKSLLPVFTKPRFCKGRGLKLIVEKCKYLTLGTCLGAGAPDAGGFGGLGAKPPAVGQFFGKKSYFNAIGSHFASVQSHLKALNF